MYRREWESEREKENECVGDELDECVKDGRVGKEGETKGKLNWSLCFEGRPKRVKMV